VRYFTVYGPWGRPDMALFKFVRQILAGQPIDLFNEGHHSRDFTHIDDAAEVHYSTTRSTPDARPLLVYRAARSCDVLGAPYRIYNIGSHSPVCLMDFVLAIEKAVGRHARKNLLPLQPGDVPTTYADVDSLIADIDFAPTTPIEEGVQKFVDWYRKYYDQ